MNQDSEGITNATSYSSYVHEKSNVNNRKDLVLKSLTNLELENKLGVFKTTNDVDVNIKVYTKYTDDGIKYDYIKLNGDNEVAVTSYNGVNYSPVLNKNELLNFSRENDGYVRTAIDPLGREKYVLVTNANGGDMAYEFETGVYRHVSVGQDDKLYLGHKVDFDKLSDPVKKNAQNIIYNTSLH